MTIRTSCKYGPVAFGKFDWMAWDDRNEYVGGDAVGFGSTEAKAIASLIKITEKVT